jgi:integrase/recombinase XerD
MQKNAQLFVKILDFKSLNLAIEFCFLGKKMKTKLLKRTEEASIKIPGFLAVLEEFRKSMLVNGLSDNSFTNYARNLALVSLRFNKLPAFVSEAEINQYLSELMQRAKSPSQSEFKHAVYSLRYYFKMIGGKMKVKLPQVKNNKKLPVVLSKEECKLLFELTKNVKHKIILMFIYSAGLRVKELRSLKWSDVDADRMMILIRQSKGKKDRYVPLSEYILNYLTVFVGLGNMGDFIFTGARSKKGLSMSSVSLIMRNAVKRAGIRKTGVCLHTLRHSFATHLLEDGLDIISIKELLGHTSLESTLTYLHVAYQPLRKKSSPLDSLFELSTPVKLEEERERFNRMLVHRKQKQRSAALQMNLFEACE